MKELLRCVCRYFFFSSRRRHTRCGRDWSSDVCSSDLMGVPVHASTSGVIEAIELRPVPHPSGMSDWCVVLKPDGEDQWRQLEPIGDYHKRSEERRVGKECRSRWSAYH